MTFGTSHLADNASSLGVSRKLGYQPDGIRRDVLHGRAVVSQRLRLTRREWELGPPKVTIAGLEPCLEQFGLDVPERA